MRVTKSISPSQLLDEFEKGFNRHCDKTDCHQCSFYSSDLDCILELVRASLKSCGNCKHLDGSCEGAYGIGTNCCKEWEKK